MLELSTVNDILAGIAKRDGETVAMWKSDQGWKPITARSMYGRVRALAAAMESWGIKRGDRIAIMSENRWEWPVVDFARNGAWRGGCAAVSDADAGAGGLHAARFGQQGGRLFRRSSSTRRSWVRASCRRWSMWWCSMTATFRTRPV